jgi:hypothetical protein
VEAKLDEHTKALSELPVTVRAPEFAKTELMAA